MSEDDVTARVEAFIADFHAAWQRSGSTPMPPFDPFAAGSDPAFDPIAWAQAQGPPDFAAWERELTQLVDAHFVPGARIGAEGALSGKPLHHPAEERIVGVQVSATTADVMSVLPDGPLDNHFTYRLSSTEHGWRITKIVRTFAPAGSRLLDPGEEERLLAGVRDAPWERPVSDELAAGVSGLFSGRHDVVDLGGFATSGVLTVHDFGWIQYDLAPLDRRVPSGTHPVQLARDQDGVNVAVRVRFSDELTTARFPAARVGSDHHVAVDAGNVAVVDFATLASCSQAQATEVFQDLAQEWTGSVFSLTGETADGAMVRSGDGDGAYPVYWGVASDGSLTDLVVDFLVDVEDVTTTHVVPWQIGASEDRELVRHGFEVLVEAEGIVFRYRERTDETALRAIRVLGSDGRPVAGSQGGTFMQGGVAERLWRPEAPVPDTARIEVVLSHGLRHRS